MATDFYDGVSEQTEAVLERMQQYVRLALDNGDAIHQERPGQLVINIRIKKDKSDGRIQDSQSKPAES